MELEEVEEVVREKELPARSEPARRDKANPKPAARSAPSGAADVWLYVTDPHILERMGDDEDPPLKVYGPEDDALEALQVPDADDIRDELEEDEYVLWAGQPSARVAGKLGKWETRIVWGLPLLGLLPICIGLAGMSGDWAIRIAVVLMGGVIASFSFVFLILRRKGVLGPRLSMDLWYLVTNRRALIWGGRDPQTIDGIRLMGLTRISYDPAEDTGTLRFGSGGKSNRAEEFACLEKLAEVEDLVREFLVHSMLEGMRDRSDDGDD